MNQRLLEDYTAEEVKNVLPQMFPFKFPDPDGYRSSRHHSGCVSGSECTEVSHLLFANDTLIFCQTSHEAMRAFRDILRLYGVAYSQSINFDKSSVFFSHNISAGDREDLANILGVRIELALPLPCSPVPCGDDSKTAMENPKATRHTYEQDFSCQVLAVGRFLECWKDLQYIVHMEEHSGGTGSHQECGRMEIGDGQRVRVWHDPWISRPHTFMPITPCHPLLQNIQVSDLMSPSQFCWNSELIDHLFYPEDARIIKSIPLGRSSMADSQIWHFDKRGTFSVKSAYHVALQCIRASSNSETVQNNNSNISWSFIWKAKCLTKSRFLHGVFAMMPYPRLSTSAGAGATWTQLVRCVDTLEKMLDTLFLTAILLTNPGLFRTSPGR
ncbi:UNVERIFIED_CONTAM: hypothetical protein Slati_4192400 [Sesamum latifolium]|uniref:Reverse transcriptase domain-containing protein n=1 Tax=Sesamum latifolium TaxID=2727402 RepID=A0AAW2TB49_9LAMI